MQHIPLAQEVNKLLRGAGAGHLVAGLRGEELGEKSSIEQRQRVRVGLGLGLK